MEISCATPRPQKAAHKVAKFQSRRLVGIAPCGSLADRPTAGQKRLGTEVLETDPLLQFRQNAELQLSRGWPVVYWEVAQFLDEVITCEKSRFDAGIDNWNDAVLGQSRQPAGVPLALLVLLLRRTLRVFQKAQVEAARTDRLRMIGEAANLIAHEVKNSLNGLQVGLELILRSEKDQSDKNRQKASLALKSEFERLSNFTVGLLTFSKGVALRLISIDLVPFVTDVVESMRLRADENHTALEIVTAQPGIKVCADPALIQVVVRNLVLNALEAVETAPGIRPRVTVSLLQSDDRALLKVTDNGPGIPASVRDRLFEPFVSGKPSGVGLGLAMSKKIADAHGGALFLEEADPLASGVTFVFAVPLDKTCAQASS